ncbi:MAG: hypothetical protein KDA21_02370, partial [Phycisphaerales bacterium]|nr:hypothetical protein [Phycisphaerales bacterium]
HRSIYNRYRPIFDYFDARQVGLTATPRDLINRNTYSLFGCEGTDPTTCFSYEEAINHTPAYLVPYRAQSVSFGFIRGGIKYSQMTPEQKAQLDEQDEEAELVEHERPNVDKQIFNRDTNRHIIRNLMEHGIRIKDGTHIGKSIIFARNHNHAVLLPELFDELYPQYGGKFCRVIDNYDPRAADLIDNFKDPTHDLTIAVSVDMLDTGIDVPEVVNLVFAKPVYSNVKFHQMIGRGTRLCPDLFGPGDHKKEFLIFDHWDNFDAFGQGIVEPDPAPQKSLLQTLYETRLELADAALNKPDADTFDTTVTLLQQDAVSLPDKTIAVRDHWREVQLARTRDTIHQFAPTTVTMLRTKVAPLMQWRNPEGGQPAYRFDLLITRMQLALLTGQNIDDHRDEVLNNLSQLQMNLSPVRAKADAISRAKDPAFWTSPTIAHLEDIRLQLRGIMKFRLLDKAPAIPPKIIDVAENPADIQRRDVTPQFAGHDEVAYRRRVTEVLQAVIDQSPALQRIRRGQPVTEADLDAIAALVVAQDPDLDLHDLRNYYPEVADHIDLAIRGIIGLDPEAVNQRFQSFLEKHPGMNATQTAFLRMLQGHIARYGTIEIDRLYEAPFTTIDAGGIDGVFNDEAQIDDILDIIATFRYAEPDDNDRGDSSHTDTTTS